MQVGHVIEGDPLTFTTLVYPDQHQNVLNYLSNQFTQFKDNLTEAGKKLYDKAYSIFQRENNQDTINRAKSMVKDVMGMFHSDAIVLLSTIEEIQSAHPTMQRYIMAYPELRSLYHLQRVDGYSDTYTDTCPNQSGFAQYEYRRATESMVLHETDEEGHYRYRIPTYFEELYPGDRDLTFQEKCDILSTWDVISHYLKQKKDPTDIYG